MAWVETRITRTAQPQDGVGIDWNNPLTKGLRLAVNPAIGSVNLVEQKAAAQSRDFAKISRPSGVSQTSGKAQYAATLDANSNLTLFSVWLARPAQYLSADALRILLSCRNASNQGWSWGRANTGVAGTGNAIGGDAITGNLTRQGFTFQGVAEYGQSTFTIPSLIATPVALRYVKSSGLLSWFSAGEKSQADTAASTNPSAGGGLVYGEQGVYGGNTGPWIDESLVTFAFARALSDAEIKSLSDNPWQIFEPEVSRIWVDDYVSAGGGATVIPIGVQATAAVGTPSATGAATTTPAGVSASSAVGTPVAVGGASIPATALPAGVQSTGAVGTVSATGAAVAQPVGVVASSAVGTPVAIAGTSIPATVLPAGVQASSAVGTPAAQGAAIAQPLGVAVIGYVGTPTIAAGVSGVAVAYPAGVQAIGQVGTLIATGAAWTAAVGVQAVSSVGTPAAYAGEIVIYVAGAQTRPSRLQSSSRPSRLQTGTRASR